MVGFTTSPVRVRDRPAVSRCKRSILSSIPVCVLCKLSRARSFRSIRCAQSVPIVDVPESKHVSPDLVPEMAFHPVNGVAGISPIVECVSSRSIPDRFDSTGVDAPCYPCGRSNRSMCGRSPSIRDRKGSESGPARLGKQRSWIRDRFRLGCSSRTCWLAAVWGEWVHHRHLDRDESVIYRYYRKWHPDQ